MTSIEHLICDHDTHSLHYNGAVLMLEGKRLVWDGRQADSASDSVSHVSSLGITTIGDIWPQ